MARKALPKGEKMKLRRTRKHNVPLSHSNLSTHENLRSRFDPNGSYTGIVADPNYAVPEQDADDL